MTVRSSRRIISAIRAETMPMPCWLAPMPSMIAILAKRTCCSISRRNSSQFWDARDRHSRSGRPAIVAEDQTKTSVVPCSPKICAATEAGLTLSRWPRWNLNRRLSR